MCRSAQSTRRWLVWHFPSLLRLRRSLNSLRHMLLLMFSWWASTWLFSLSLDKFLELLLIVMLSDSPPQRLELKQETIELDSYDTIDAKSLQSRIPTDHARYHFFLYKHNYEGDYLESIGRFLITCNWSVLVWSYFMCTFFFGSFHLLNAWLQVFNQREDAVLQL